MATNSCQTRLHKDYTNLLKQIKIALKIMKNFKNKIIIVILLFGILVPVYFAKAQVWEKIYPKCIQQQMEAQNAGDFKTECDDVGVFVELAINIGAFLFTFYWSIGTFGFCLRRIQDDYFCWRFG